MYARYADGELILETIRKREMTRTDIVRAMGYTNITKGLRRLDRCISAEAVRREEFLAKAARVLDISEEKFEEATKRTQEQIQDEEEEKQRRIEEHERRTFRPYLYLETVESRPASITMVAFAGVRHYKCVDLPEGITSLPRDEELKTVGEIIRSHYPGKEHTRRMFGPIVGYIYRRAYDDSIRFSVEGKVLEGNLGKMAEGRATLQVGKKKLEGGLLERWRQ